MNTVWDRRASTTFAIRKFDDDRLCGGVLRRRGRTSRLQPAFHLSMVDQPGLLRYRTTAVEDDKVRYAANIETGRELRIALGVNLDNERAARHIRRAGNLRCRHLTRTTHAAQKSTSTGTREFCVISSNCSGSTSRGSSTGGDGDLHAPHRPVSARCFAGIRFFRPQLLQVRTRGIPVLLNILPNSASLNSSIGAIGGILVL